MTDNSTAGSKASGRAMTALLVFLAICLGLFIFQYNNFYLWAKAIHIMAVIAWMAGMFYMPRLFVYHTDTAPGSEASETFKVMEYRLMKTIMNPAMILTWIFGLYLAWAEVSQKTKEPEIIQAPFYLVSGQIKFLGEDIHTVNK